MTNIELRTDVDDSKYANAEQSDHLSKAITSTPLDPRMNMPLAKKVKEEKPKGTKERFFGTNISEAIEIIRNWSRD